MKKIIVVAAFVLGAFALGKMIADSLTSQDKIDCYKWQREAKSREYRNYYITPNQKQQCDWFNIEIDAPIENH